MERGALKLVLLDALNDGAKHGYEIIKALEKRTNGQYAPSPGTVYPTLLFLEDLGMVRANQDGDRRVYELTDLGRTELATNAEKLQAFWGRFAATEASQASRHEVGFLQEELDALFRTVWSGAREVIERGDKETLKRVRQALHHCQEEIRDIIAETAEAQPKEG